MNAVSGFSADVSFVEGYYNEIFQIMGPFIVCSLFIPGVSDHGCIRAGNHGT